MSFLKYILKLDNRTRKILLASFDVFNLFLALSVSLYLLEVDKFLENFNSYLVIFPLSAIIATPIFIFTGQYKSLTRYIGSQSFYRLILRKISLVFFLVIISQPIIKSQLSLTFWMTYLFILISISILFRIFLRDTIFKLKNSDNKKNSREALVIYGSIKSCIPIVDFLRKSKNYNIMAIIDDNPNFSTRYLDNIPIKETHYIEEIKSKLNKILIVEENFNKLNKTKLITNLSRFEIPLYFIPSFNELIVSSKSLNFLKPISIEDLLSRDYVPPQRELLGPFIKDKVICISGAGGSIGSELCRKILNLCPKIIILIDNNEPSLYKVEKELNQLCTKKDVIHPILINCCDENNLIKVFKKFSIDVFFHAAAYKHVAIVEKNPLSGIQNNVFSTLSICKLSAQFSINSVVLISSDKAVRPTNVMGATKRLSELIFQSFAEKYPETKFSMVRFGNVLGSSGSVVPLFKEQISKGGPITLTDENVIRYFMTVEEAALLVIQSNVISNSGDVLLLDMGKPVKIIDLARNLIKLSGLEVKDKDNPNGDIEIKIIGLRNGEKLFEELLIEPQSTTTEHPLIFKAREKSIDSELLDKTLEEIKYLVYKNDTAGCIKKLKILIPEWKLSESMKLISEDN